VGSTIARLTEPWHALLFLLVVFSTNIGAAAEGHRSAFSSITRDDLLRHLSFLASDTLEGRESGTRGGHAAAAYLVDRLKSLGAQPAGDKDSYIQEFGRGYRNVLAVIPGSDPALKDEYILLGAHFDHVGYGNRSNSNGPIGHIHNGADDNGSGVSGLLEVAQAITKFSEPLPRSIVIAFWDGEEKGLLGSKHWVEHPTIPLAQIRFAINLDMIGRVSEETLTVYGARTCVGLRQMVVRGNEEPQLRLKFDLSHKDDSDHYTFFEKSIPYLMLWSGEHADYHRPSDDVDKVNFQGMEQVTKIVLSLTLELGEAKKIGPFRGDCRNEHSLKTVRMRACPARLGVTWSADRKLGEPFPVIRVDAGSAAEKAGIAVGDRIVTVNGKPAAELDDLRTVVSRCECDLELGVQQGGESPKPTVVHLGGFALPPGSEAVVDPADAMTAVLVKVDGKSPAGASGFQLGDRLMLSPTHETTPAGTIVKSWVVEREGRLKTISID
jgi:hypothetical protein